MPSVTLDRRVLVVGGAVLALVAGVAIAVALRGKSKPTTPPVGPTGLVVESAPSTKLDPNKNLRCFVGGQLVGEFTLAECARRNGVAAGALDVGIDANGELGAAMDAGSTLTPLPPAEATAADGTAQAQPAAAGAATPTAPAAAPQAAAPSAPRVAMAACWRYEGGWNRLPGEQTLNACVQTLYAGRCERISGAAYGRWGDQTLRLVPRKVEISSDNRSFRTLVDQAGDCSLPALP